jgi:hypothetical protein
MTQTHASFYRQWLDDNKVSRGSEYFDYKGQSFKLEYLNSKYYAVNLNTGREFHPSCKTKIEAIYRACVAFDSAPGYVPIESNVSIMMQVLAYIETSYILEALSVIDRCPISQQRTDSIEAMTRVINL